MQYLGFAIDWLYSTAGLLILGTLVITRLTAEELTTPTNARLFNAIRTLAGVLVVSGLFLPSIQAVAIAGETSAAVDAQSLSLILFSTRFGSVWAAQEGIACLLVICLLSKTWWVRTNRTHSLLYLLIALISILLFIGAFKGHAAGLEPAWPGLLGHGLHLLAAGSWLGALPALIFLIRANSHKQDNRLTAQLITRFSVLATAMVGIILMSGTLIGYLQIERWGELFATLYGQFVLIKVALFIMMLMIAYMIRQRFMPQFKANHHNAVTTKKLANWLMIETAIGFILLGVANIIKTTTPAAHEEIVAWPFSFRLSLDATWGTSTSIQSQVTLGVLLIITALGLFIYLQRVKKKALLAVFSSVCLTLVGAFISLKPLAIEAYPDTYRNASVPYDAISISNGAELFSQQCIACHGVEGKGNGPLTDTLDVMVMSLDHSHSASATAGDMYWSLTQEQLNDQYHNNINLDEDEIWELINFLSAQTNSYTGLSLYHYIDPLNPFLGAPDFYYTTNTSSGNLKDFRDDKAVLLVLYSWPEDKHRLDELEKHHKEITATETEIITVEISNTNKNVTKPDYPFTVVSEQTQPIIDTYSHFRRSKLSNRDYSIAHPVTHIEFIIDRFGYLRARWIPEANTKHWTDFSLLTNELNKLAKEPEVLPPPDEHVH